MLQESMAAAVLHSDVLVFIADIFSSSAASCLADGPIGLANGTGHRHCEERVVCTAPTTHK